MFANPIIHLGIFGQEFMPVPTQWEAVHVITGSKENKYAVVTVLLRDLRK
jgi:hypothetical protein